MSPAEAKALGSYEQWTAVVGGVLEHAGINGFLTNLPDFYDQADMEGAAWRQIVEAWWEKYGSEKVGAGDLFTLVSEMEVLELGKGNERAQRISFGKQLSRQRDRVIGDYRILSAGKSMRLRLWMLERLTNCNPGGPAGVYKVYEDVCSVSFGTQQAAR